MFTTAAVLWLTLNIYHEARGEPPRVQQAVAHTTLNRSRATGETIKKTVLKPAQFSWTLKPGKIRERPWEKDPKTFVACGSSALAAMVSKDFTGGATHFHEADMKHKPKWTKKVTRVARYGGFIFYKERKG